MTKRERKQVHHSDVSWVTPDALRRLTEAELRYSQARRRVEDRSLLRRLPGRARGNPDLRSASLKLGDAIENLLAAEDRVRLTPSEYPDAVPVEAKVLDKLRLAFHSQLSDRELANDQAQLLLAKAEKQVGKVVAWAGESTWPAFAFISLSDFHAGIPLLDGVIQAARSAGFWFPIAGTVVAGIAENVAERGSDQERRIIERQLGSDVAARVADVLDDSRKLSLRPASAGRSRESNLETGANTARESANDSLAQEGKSEDSYGIWPAGGVALTGHGLRLRRLSFLHPSHWLPRPAWTIGRCEVWSTRRSVLMISRLTRSLAAPQPETGRLT